MSDQPTFQAVITDSLARLEFPVSITPLPDKFGADYKALHDFHIAQLAKEVAEAPPITDKASFEVNQKLRTRLVKTRTGLDSTRKALFDPMRQLKAEVDAYIGTTPDAGLQGRIKEQERIIEAKQRVWEEEKERIRQEAQKIIDDRNKARAKALDDMAFRFDGVAFWIGDHGHPLAMRIAQGAAYTMTDKEWNETIEVATRNSAELAMEKQAEDDFQALLDAGMTEDPTTGHAVYDEIWAEGRLKIDHPIVMREELHGAPRQRVENMLHQVRNAEGLKARERAERESAQEEAERKEKARAEAELAEMRRERTELREKHLWAIGANEDKDGLWTLGHAEVSRELLGTMNAEEWNASLIKFEAEAEVRSIEKATAQPVEELAPALIPSPNLPGIFYDEKGMPVSKEGAPIVLAPQPKPDFGELHACALALLDEANKAFSLHGNDLELSADLAKVQGHAMEAVNITKALRS